jgi:transposase
MQPA